MKKIVLTGGPCAGKTTALSKIINYFTDKGVDVYALPEAATLFNQAGVEERVRKRGNGNDWIYFYTRKESGYKEERIETERQISVDEYNQLLKLADKQRNTIHKTRNCFVYEHQYFELDTFIQPASGLCLLEIEGRYQAEKIIFPPFLKVLEDVTGNRNYYNANIAATQNPGS